LPFIYLFSYKVNNKFTSKHSGNANLHRSDASLHRECKYFRLLVFVDKEYGLHLQEIKCHIMAPIYPLDGLEPQNHPINTLGAIGGLTARQKSYAIDQT
jgi:hypothetical protein